MVTLLLEFPNQFELGEDTTAVSAEKTDAKTSCISCAFCFSLKGEVRTRMEKEKKRTTITIKFKLNYNTGEADNCLEIRQNQDSSTWNMCWTV